MEAPAPARRLTTHQQAVLIQVLLAFPKQRVAIEHTEAGDAPSYARDFLTIFNAVRWDVAELGVAKGSAGNGSGLAVVVGKDQNVPAGAEALRDALRIYGIDVETKFNSACEIEAGDFIFSVGAHAQ
jgi:hypothetical protein